MKKISIILLTLFLVYSCTDNLEDLNTDVKNASEATGGSFLTSAQKNLTDNMSNINVNRNNLRQWVQHVSTTTYHDEARYDITNRKIPDGLFATMYRDVLMDLKESSRIVTAIRTFNASEAAVKKNQLAVLEIMQVYTYSTLVETFGDIPYTESLDISNVLPKYDNGLTIYKDLINRLSAAITNLDTSEDSFGTADLIYGGNTGKWEKFANSLKLRMGLRIFDVDATFATIAVQQAVTSGVFTSNADNAIFKYLNSQPNGSQMWMDLVVSGRKDYVAANTLVDYMNGVNDPRRAVYFQLKDGVYKGGVYATSNSKYNNFSRLGEIFHEPTLPQIHMDFSSVEFLLAEAAERSLAGMTPVAAEAHYNTAITASFAYYGVSGVTTYLLQPSVAYTTATGTWKQKIGTQKWIALYNQGYEAWTEYRRLDYPVLTAPALAVAAAEGKVPVRYTYPIGEQTKNGANYTAAAAAIGSDKLTTKLFWDKF